MINFGAYGDFYYKIKKEMPVEQPKTQTVDNQDRTLYDEQITGMKTVKEKSKGLDSIKIKMKI